MIRLGLQFALFVFVVCSYCGNDFVLLGHHSWRCKSRMMDNEPKSSSTSGHLNVEERAIIGNSQEIVCCCGKKCKGMKGLKMHQSSCRTLHGLNDNLSAKLQEDILENAKESDVLSVDGQSNDILENENVTNAEEIFVLKRGAKLPKSAIEWSLAKEYFKAVLSNQPIRNEG